jgi:hypothetical protein
MAAIINSDREQPRKDRRSSEHVHSQLMGHGHLCGPEARREPASPASDSARLTSPRSLCPACPFPTRPRLWLRFSIAVQQIAIELLQSLELLYPLFKGQAAEGRHLHRSVEPIGRLAVGEVEIAIALRELSVCPRRFSSALMELRVRRMVENIIALRLGPVFALSAILSERML